MTIKPLSHFAAGTVIEVLRIDAGHEIERKLSVFGINEGAEIRLLQYNPVPILQIGCSEVAIDRKLAAFIWGRKR